MGRLPLQVVPDNVLNGKPVRLVTKKAVVEVAATATTHEQTGAADGEDEKLIEWRRQWRHIMSRSVMYFDGPEPSSLETVKGNLTLLGSEFQPFFDRSVTHVVTNRSPDGDYPPGDIIYKARKLEMKVWTVEKLIRFLTSLLGYSPTRPLDQAQSAKLSQLLQQEKLTGPSDRDLSARRDDFIFFRNPYVLVWDPSHYYRPIIHKQWTQSNEWPKLHTTYNGACPFVPDPRGTKRKRDEKDTENRRQHARLLKAGAPISAAAAAREASKNKNGVLAPAPVLGPAMQPTWSQPQSQAQSHSQPAQSQSQSQIQPHSHSLQSQLLALPPPPKQSQTQTGLAEAQESLADREPLGDRENTLANGPGQKFTEIVASGIQRYSATSATRSTTQSGGPEMGGILTSREVAYLQRKVLKPPAPIVPTRAKAKKPGFCENCLERFDNFDDHVMTRKHRKYAACTHNFDALDSIIGLLARKPLEPASSDPQHEHSSH